MREREAHHSHWLPQRCIRCCQGCRLYSSWELPPQLQDSQVKWPCAGLLHVTALQHSCLKQAQIRQNASCLVLPCMHRHMLTTATRSPAQVTHLQRRAPRLPALHSRAVAGAR